MLFATHSLLIFISLSLSSAVDNNCVGNETYTESDNHGCINTCEHPTFSWVCRPAGPKPGCICKEGYIRNGTRKCVLYEDCDTCKPNEYMKECTNKECENTCLEPEKDKTCNKTEGCYPSCVCRQGYLRDVDEKCVKPEECKTLCKDPNEIYDKCDDMCPKTCINKDEVNRVCPKVCAKGGCVCKEGYVRDLDRKCIKPEECPKCSSPDEFFACGPTCDVTCTDAGVNCMEDRENCTRKCYCKPGFVRYIDGTCIPSGSCPKTCPTDKKALVLPCGDPCPLTCDNRDEEPKQCTSPCIQNGCKCDFGFALNDFNECIHIKLCPEKCPTDPNAYRLYCGDPCAVTCENMNRKEVCRKHGLCIRNGCKCKNGYVLNSNGKCILKKDCPPSTLTPQCGENEIYDKCPNKTCTPETCQSIANNVKIVCVNNTECKPACVCKEGYVRESSGFRNGKCVDKITCCKDPNAEYIRCVIPCPGGTCDMPQISNCQFLKCNEGCQCKSGYVKISNTNRKCVPLGQCNYYKFYEP